MIVVNHGAAAIGKTVEVKVISMLKTTAGTRVFAEFN